MLSELQQQIAYALRDGADLDSIEAELIDPALVDEEQKAALWLYAEALQARRSRIVFATGHSVAPLIGQARDPREFGPG